MNTDHVDAYLKAMNDKDFAQIAQHLSENVVLLSPVFPEPFEGKDAVVKVLSCLLETIDSIQVNLRLASGSDVAFSFTIECDGITIIGNEFIRLDENGLIERFEVAWRPLASAVLIQEKLAEKLGGQPMRLVPRILAGLHRHSRVDLEEGPGRRDAIEQVRRARLVSERSSPPPAR
jgi:SnoaL-like domain